MNNLKNLFLSSTGNGLAMRWKAFFSAVVPTLALVGPLVGIDFLSTDNLNLFSEWVEKAIVLVWEAVSGILFLKGWARRTFYKEKQLGKFRAAA